MPRRWLLLPPPLRRWLRQGWTPVAHLLRYPPLWIILLLALPALVLVYQSSPTRSIAVGRADDSRYLRGFFARERDDLGDFRWTGSESAVVLPAAPGNATWTVTLRASGARPPGGAPPALDVVIDERLVARFTTSQDYRDYTFSFTRPLLPPETLTLTLRTPTMQVPGDERALGVRLAGVTLAPAPKDHGLPFLVPPPLHVVVVLALLGVLLGLCAHLRFGRRTAALIVAGALGGILGGTARYPDETAGLLPALLLFAGALLFGIMGRHRLPPPTARWVALLRRRLAARALPGLLAILLGGLAIRLGLALVAEPRGDAILMREWADRLATVPLAQFYAAPAPIDHLPGDLWVLWGLTGLHHALWPDRALDGQAFFFLLRLPPALADLGCGIMLYLLGRRFAGPVAGLLASALFTFNPASIFLTAIWGQWDPLSASLMLLALWLLLRGNFGWSLPVLAYAALIKPQLAALAPLFVLASLRAAGFSWPWRSACPVAPRLRARWLPQAGLAVVVSVVVLIVVPLPFGVGPPPLPTHWSLLERVAIALGKYPYTDMGGFTFWTTPLARLGALPLASGALRTDLQPWLLGLSYRSWGTLLFGAAYGAITLCYWRRGSQRALVWACLAITDAAFVLLTRVHERYVFPAFVIAALAAAIAPDLRRVYAGLSLTFLANLYYAHTLQLPLVWMAPSQFIYAVSLLNVALLLYIGLRAVSAFEREAPETDTQAIALQAGSAAMGNS